MLEAHLALPILELGVVELEDAAAAGAHHVVVTLARRDLLVDVVLAAEAGLASQAALHEQVEGEVQVGRLVVAGTVKGVVRVKERLVVHGSGKVLAEVFAPTLVVDEGGVMEGVVHMTAPVPSGERKAGELDTKGRTV